MLATPPSELPPVLFNFCASRCNVCVTRHETNDCLSLIPSEDLLLCSNCKFILYCGRAHQKADWKTHKVFCQGIRKILDESKVNHGALNHVLDINGPIKGSSKEHYRKVRTVLKAVLLIHMGRELDQHEKEMVFFPNVCVKCYDYDRKQIELCKTCKIIYICKECADQKDSTIHSEELCKQLRINYNLFIGTIQYFPFNDLILK